MDRRCGAFRADAFASRREALFALAVGVPAALPDDAFALRVDTFFAPTVGVPTVFRDDAFASSRAFAALRSDAFAAAFAVNVAARRTDAFTVLPAFPAEAPEAPFCALSRTVRVTETRADFRPGDFVSFFRMS